ncbi:hypothetical protein J4206_06970 [Candidatus Woesearchaeota archaeon]|nr:hypothetical protein [Candidatus Woesearchaeota archaeon]
MKITIDTSQDSKEDIRKVVALLSNYLNSSESSVIGNSSGVFPEPVSEGGFFGAESNNIGLSEQNVVNTVASASTNSSNSLSNNNSVGSNASTPQTQEQPMPFINIFGDESSANTSAGNSNSSNNVLSNNNSVGNNLGSTTNVPSQTSSPPDIFSVFGSANNSNNNQNNVGGIGAVNNYNNSNNIGTGVNNLGNSTAAVPKKTFAGIFKGIPILGNLSFGQDDHEELTEEEKAAAKKVVEY